jgi:NTE family protein
MSLALVLGGGGVAGVAWETGLLLGVQDSNGESASTIAGAIRVSRATVYRELAEQNDEGD